MADKRNKLTYTIEIDDKGKIKVDGVKSSFEQLEQKVRSATTANPAI